MCIQYLSDKKSISKLHNSTILHFAVKVWPTAAITLQKYFFSLVQLTPYEYGFRGYLHFFCTIANKNTATTYVRPGGLCYKTREICHGVILWWIQNLEKLPILYIQTVMFGRQNLKIIDVRFVSFIHCSIDVKIEESYRRRSRAEGYGRRGK